MAHRLIVEIRNGVVNSVYGDAMPIALDVIVRDLDNIEAGDIDPLTEQDKSDAKKMVYYW